MDAGTAARKKLGSFLRELRSGNRLTLRAVEALSRSLPEPVSFDYLSRAESGQFIPSPEKLITLSHVYEIPSQQFLDQIELAQLLSLASTETDPARLRQEGLAAAERGDYSVAYGSFKKALVLLEAKEDPEARAEFAKARTSLAIVLMCLGKYRLAQREAESVLELEELSGNTRAAALNTIATVHYQLTRFDLAEAAAKAAARVARKAGAPAMLARALVNLANVRFDQKQFDSARRLYLRGLNLPEGAVQGYDRGITLVNLANCYAVSDAPEATDAAEAAFGEALALAHACASPPLKAICLLKRGRFLYCRGRAIDARAVLHEARSIATTSQLPSEMFHSTFYLWRIALEAGVASEAGELFKALKRLRLGVDHRSEEIGFFDRALDEFHPSRRRKGVRHARPADPVRPLGPVSSPVPSGHEGG